MSARECRCQSYPRRSIEIPHSELCTMRRFTNSSLQDKPSIYCSNNAVDIGRRSDGEAQDKLCCGKNGLDANATAVCQAYSNAQDDGISEAYARSE